VDEFVGKGGTMKESLASDLQEALLGLNFYKKFFGCTGD
jgi:hypothetical protein